MSYNCIIVCSEEKYNKNEKYLSQFNLFKSFEKYEDNFEDSSNNIIVIDYDSLNNQFNEMKHKFIFSPIILIINEKINYDFLLEYSFDEYIFINSSMEENTIRIKNILKKKSWETVYVKVVVVKKVKIRVFLQRFNLNHSYLKYI